MTGHYLAGCAEPTQTEPTKPQSLPSAVCEDMVPGGKRATLGILNLSTFKFLSQELLMTQAWLVLGRSRGHSALWKIRYVRGPPCLGAQVVSPTPCLPAISYRGLPCRLPALHRCEPVDPRLLCSGGVLYGNDCDCQTPVSATRSSAEVDHVRFSWSSTWSLHDTGFPGGSHCEFTNTTRVPGSTFISAQPHGWF